MTSNTKRWCFSNAVCCSQRYAVVHLSSYAFTLSGKGTWLTCPCQMLFFASRCERLCLLQFSLINLIPGLVRSLQDCADPALDTYAQTVSKATQLRTSERSSCKCPASTLYGVDNFSTCICGPTPSDFRQGNGNHTKIVTPAADLSRMPSSAPTLHCSSWIFYPIANPTWLDLRILCSSSRKTDTATY